MVRSYRLCFELERRIHKIDRWRIPVPYGVPLRGIAYALAAIAAVIALSGLPLAGDLLGALHPAIRLVVLPVAAGYALCRVQVDGRPAHAAALAWLRFRVGARAQRRLPTGGAARLLTARRCELRPRRALGALPARADQGAGQAAAALSRCGQAAGTIARAAPAPGRADVAREGHRAAGRPAPDGERTGPVRGRLVLAAALALELWLLEALTDAPFGSLVTAVGAHYVFLRATLWALRPARRGGGARLLATVCLSFAGWCVALGALAAQLSRPGVALVLAGLAALGLLAAILVARLPRTTVRAAGAVLRSRWGGRLHADALARLDPAGGRARPAALAQADPASMRASRRTRGA